MISYDVAVDRLLEVATDFHVESTAVITLAGDTLRWDGLPLLASPLVRATYAVAEQLGWDGMTHTDANVAAVELMSAYLRRSQPASPVVTTTKYAVHFQSPADATLIVHVTLDVPVRDVADRFTEVIDAATVAAAKLGVTVNDYAQDWDVEAIIADGDVVWPHLPN